MTRVTVERPEATLVVVSLHGEYDAYSAPEVRRELDSALEGGSAVIVDLRAAEFIDSVVAAALLESRKQAKQADLGFAVLLNDSKSNHVRRMFELSGLTTMFAIYESVPEASDAIRTGFVDVRPPA